MTRSEFIPTPPHWPHAHLRPRSESEAERLLTVSPEDLIFVFGSNLAGRHGAGAAYDAMQYFGAVYGMPFGMQGQSFAITTLDERFHRLPIKDLASRVNLFLRFAAGRPRWTFYVTAIGTGLAGFTAEQIAPLFANAPSNCLLPPEWTALLSTPELTGKDL